MWKSLRKIECSLDDWEEALPDYLKGENANFINAESVNGASNLWFGFLSLKLLICRVGLRVSSNIPHEISTY